MNALGLLIASTLLAVAPASADPYASDWAASPKSRARLIVDGAGGAGLEIELAPGAITYWRDPGDSGLPPTFDFSGSGNLASAEIMYPAPRRIAEPDGSEAFGYRDAVVFPIRLATVAAGAPAEVNVNVDYAVCEKVCLPAHAHLQLTAPTGISTPYAAEIDAARKNVPKRIEFATLGADLTNLDARDWRLCLPASPVSRDLFVEPPSGFWLTVKPAASEGAQACFAIALAEAPAGAAPRSLRKRR